MLGTFKSLSTTESSALAAPGQQTSNVQWNRSNQPWCEHCRRTRHTKETCWKIHGKPADWKPRYSQDKDGRGNVATTETRKQSEPSPFSKEQMKLLPKMLQESFTNALTSTGTASVAQKDHLLTSFNARQSNTQSWVVNSRASDII